MSDKPERLRLIHVPIYASDEIILRALPLAGSTSQWMRNLIFRQLHLDAQMMQTFSEHAGIGDNGRSGDSEMTREEVRRVIQDELEPILEKLDESMDKVIDEKLEVMKQAIMQAVQESIKATFSGQGHVNSGKMVPDLGPESEPESKPASESEIEDDIPAWQRALGQGITAS